MPSKPRTWSSLALLVMVLAVTAACGGGGGDKLDTATLQAGASAAGKLKFAMKEKGMLDGALTDNAQFDDAANLRVVLYYDAAMRAKVDALAPGDLHQVTFIVVKAPGAAKMVEGKLTALE